jgi:hypothetical protein
MKITSVAISLEENTSVREASLVTRIPTAPSSGKAYWRSRNSVGEVLRMCWVMVRKFVFGMMSG